MKTIFVHLSGSKRGKTEVFDNEKIVIGTDSLCDLRFDPDKDRFTSPLHAEIEFKDCNFILRDKGSQKGTFINKELVKEALLLDGDLIEFGEKGPKIRFRVRTDEADVCKPVVEMLKDAIDRTKEQPTGRLATAATFLKELAWEAITQSSMSLRITIVSILILFICGIVAIPYFSLQRFQQTAERIQILEKEHVAIEKERLFVENLIKEYSPGVCLIQGSYYFIEETSGEPLTFEEEEEGGGFSAKPVVHEYTGTGFLISKDGILVTNRHVAEPWWGKQTFYPPSEFKLAPKFEVLRAFFPGIEKPFPLKVEKLSVEADVALLSIEMDSYNIPALELDTTGRDAIVGEPIVLLGYPAGLSAILAKLSQTAPDGIEMLKELPFLNLAEVLSNRGMIRPYATQGHVTDALLDKIIFDAQTTLGGSGGPLFNRTGKVIGINYGIFTGFKGSNFALPIKYALRLMSQEQEEEE
ncbi:MAG TPA: trypsin-like peptidase domain-containing protein [Candidatus Brocadiia bacterium]|nr:trypsin-like peptidase domain-containing protein [Planctomycetota bacterium]MDO8093123.1 trypsin-like peptidase domain-containing protein [Candidatus Brocadiales bacterium]